MKAADVLKALRQRHNDSLQWAFFAELRAGTGYRMSWAKNGHQPLNPEQRFDAWVLNLWPSKNFLRIAYEIKVSRSDFLHEIKHPEKREQALLMSNQFYFAAPKGLIKPEELPPEAGLIEVENGYARLKVEAPYRETEPPTWRFLASIARRVAREEKEIETCKNRHD